MPLPKLITSKVGQKISEKLTSIKTKVFETWYSFRFLPSLSVLDAWREDNKQNDMKIKDFKFPLIQFENLNHYFLKYLISSKEPNDFAFNQTNFLIIMGPEGVGKSWFIKYNLKTLFDTELTPKPKIMHWDLSVHKTINFDTFLHHFKILLINSIISSSSLNLQVIKDIFFHSYADEYVEIFAKDSIRSWLDDTDELLLDEEAKSQLEVIWNELMVNKGRKLLMKSTLFEEVVTILGRFFDSDLNKSAIHFCLSMISKMEFEHRPKEYINTYYQTGIETTDFLFDIINYLSGYHELNCYLNDVPKLPHSEIFQKYAHFSLILENLDTFLLHSSKDPRVLDFWDSIYLRLFSEENQRTHFPIIIESANSMFYNRMLSEMMHKSEEKVSSIEMTGFKNQEEVKFQLSHIYNLMERKGLEGVLGMNLGDWNHITQYFDLFNVFVNYFDRELLEEGNEHVYKVLELEGRFMERERNKFRAKLNHSFSRDECFVELDDGTIDFKMMQIMEKLVETRGRLNINTPFNDNHFAENPIIKSLLQSNVLYLRKYDAFIFLNKFLFTLFLKEWIAEQKKKKTLFQKLTFLLKKKTIGFDFSSANLVTSGEIIKFPGKADGKKILEHEFGRAYRQKMDMDEDYRYPRYTGTTVEYKKEET